MKRVENLNVRGVRTQGIVRDDVMHPHLHCLVPAGGFSKDRARGSAAVNGSSSSACTWQPLPESVPEAARGCVGGRETPFVRRAHVFKHAAGFDRFVSQLEALKWVVYAKRPFGGPEYVLKYLARYTHRVAISSGRLISCENGRVSFRWRDSANGNQQKVMTLDAVEFIRRFLQHALLQGSSRSGTSVSWRIPAEKGFAAGTDAVAEWGATRDFTYGGAT